MKCVNSLILIVAISSSQKICFQFTHGLTHRALVGSASRLNRGTQSVSSSFINGGIESSNQWGVTGITSNKNNDKKTQSPIRLGMSSQFPNGDDKTKEIIAEIEDIEDVDMIEKALTQFDAFREMALPYFKESKSGRWLFAGMIALTLLNSGVSVAFSYVGRDFWSALSSKDPTRFNEMLVKFSGALLVGAPVSVIYRFQREKLSIHWREWMTDRTIQLYTSNRVYYSLQSNAQNSGATDETVEIDNPDQRIAEDVRTFTTFSLQLFITVITSVIDLGSFSFILYSIQPQLFVAIIAYAAFGTLTTTTLGKKLIGLNYDRLQKEADFRYSLVRIRDNAESIAFYAGEDLENREISDRLSTTIESRNKINVSTRNLEFFTTAYQYFVQIVPVSVVAPQFFSGAIELGVVSQSSGAFNHILNDLSLIVNQFENLASFSAGVERLSQFMEAIRDADQDREAGSPLMQLPLNATALKEELMKKEKTNGDAVSTAAIPAFLPTIALHQREAYSTTTAAAPSSHLDNNAVLNLQNLTLVTPDRRRTLIQNLDFTLAENKNLLIVGNSGAGKSSLLRAIAGLWTAGSGSITRPSEDDVYFLPQRPYCALGTLKDQLLYPSFTNENIDATNATAVVYPEGHRVSNTHLFSQSLTDEDFLNVLEQVQLSDLASRSSVDGDPIKGLNTVMDWSNTLSLGEQQRLAFGRLLVNRPKLVIMDEATSALDMVAESRMYKLLQELSSEKNGSTNGNSDNGQGLTYISVGHRPSLLNYHDVRLRLEGDDGFSVSDIDETLVSRSNQKRFDVVENI